MYIQHHTITQRNKRSFSTITSRVSVSRRRHHCHCWNPGKEGRSVDEYKNSVAITTGQLPSLQQPNCYCRCNSHVDITDEMDTTRLADHRSSHQLKESLHTVSRTMERFSNDIRCRPNCQRNSFTNEYLRDRHTSFTRGKDVHSHWQRRLDWLSLAR